MSSVWIRPQNGLPLFKGAINSAAATVPLVAAITSQIIRCYKIWFVVSGATNITFQDGTTALSGAAAMTANGSFVLDMDGDAWFTTTAGNALNLLNSGSVQISGTVYYTAGQA